jgi:hypothetical protein
MSQGIDLYVSRIDFRHAMDRDSVQIVIEATPIGDPRRVMEQLNRLHTQGIHNTMRLGPIVQPTPPEPVKSEPIAISTVKDGDVRCGSW